MKTQRETPDWLINKMISLLDLCYGNSVLEPSCGEGKIINALIEESNSKDYQLDITGVELNQEKFEKAIYSTVSPRVKITKQNFLDFAVFYEKVTWDRIIACPPFKNAVDQEHIQAMYQLLADNGTIVTLTKYSEWMTGILGEKFRNWLSKLNHKLIVIPDNTFVEKRKSVPTSILIIRK